ncbi:MAG TPA: PAS domain S-box protein, partial [Solirubrobacteraceae bacterium]
MDLAHPRPSTVDPDDAGNGHRAGATAELELELRNARAERDSAQAALSDSEQHIRRTFDAAAVGIVTISLQPGLAGRLLNVNDAFCKFIGRPADRLLGEAIEDFTHPADRELSRDVFAALAAGERSVVRHLERRFVHANGYTVWGALTTAAVAPAEGRRPYVVALV